MIRRVGGLAAEIVFSRERLCAWVCIRERKVLFALSPKMLAYLIPRGPVPATRDGADAVLLEIKISLNTELEPESVERYMTVGEAWKSFFESDVTYYFARHLSEPVTTPQCYRIEYFGYGDKRVEAPADKKIMEILYRSGRIGR